MVFQINQERFSSICRSVQLEAEQTAGFDFPCTADPYHIGGEAITRIHERVLLAIGKRQYDGPVFITGDNNERRLREIVEMVRENLEGVVLAEIETRQTFEHAIGQWRQRCAGWSISTDA